MTYGNTPGEHADAAVQSITPLGAGNLFDLAFLRDGRLSPDGRHVVYSSSRVEDVEERTRIFIASIDGEKQRILPYGGNATSARWSPNGDSIAFVGDGRLRVAAFPSLLIEEPLTPEHLIADGAASWSPDGSFLAIALRKNAGATGLKHITIDPYRADELGFIDDYSQIIYEVGAFSRSLRRLTPVGVFSSKPSWSPDGKRLIFFASRDAIPFASYSPTLMTVDFSDGAIDELLGKEWFVASAVWLPNSRDVLVTAARQSTLTIPILSLWVIKPDKQYDLRTPQLSGNIGFHIHHDMPAWDLTRNNAVVALDSDTAFVSIQIGGRVSVWRVTIQGYVAADKVLSGDRSCIVLDVNVQSSTLLFATTDTFTPPELALADLHSFNERRITHLNDAVLVQWPRFDLKRASFESSDGLEIENWYLCLAGSQYPLPTILFVHGGPFTAAGYAFRYDLLLLAANGYGVVYANFRGSAGYGESFSRAIMGDWGERGFPDHMGTVDEVIDRGFADPERLGVWGPSHGGFATCWIVGHTTRFKAAIAEAAVTNFTTFYYLSDAPEYCRRDLGGRPHEIPDVYRARSPITYAHRCSTPTLLVHGEDDLRCPIGESEQFYRALKDVDCITELIRIPACSHMGDSMGPLPARLAQNEALLEWFGRYL